MFLRGTNAKIEILDVEGLREGTANDQRAVPPIAARYLLCLLCRSGVEKEKLPFSFNVIPPVQSPLAKIFRFSFDPNHFYIASIPAQCKGAFRDRHERKVGMRWTRMARLTSVLTCGRRSRVVLTPRRWRQVSRSDPRKRRWQESPVTWESAKEAVKTIACGNAGRSR